MSFKIPSHNNSNNERRGRRANWKQNVRPNKNIIARLTEMAKNNKVTKSANSYTVKTFLSTYEITLTPDGLHCRCSDKRDIGTCSHIIAAEQFAAQVEAAAVVEVVICTVCGNTSDDGQNHWDCDLLGAEAIAEIKVEIEKQAKIAAARALLADLESETAQAPSKGFVNVSRAKVLAAAERVRRQDFACQIRKTDTGKYEVYSFASTNTYRVELNRGIFGVTGWCECFDFTFARITRDEVCKHLAAVYFFERQERVVSLNECSVSGFREAA